MDDAKLLTATVHLQMTIRAARMKRCKMTSLPAQVTDMTVCMDMLHHTFDG